MSKSYSDTSRNLSLSLFQTTIEETLLDALFLLKNLQSEANFGKESRIRRRESKQVTNSIDCAVRSNRRLL